VLVAPVVLVVLIAPPPFGHLPSTTVACGAFRERFPDPLLEGSRLLPPRDRERAVEFGLDLIDGSAECG
jgi:hypothetical protein